MKWIFNRSIYYDYHDGRIPLLDIDLQQKGMIATHYDKQVLRVNSRTFEDKTLPLKTLLSPHYTKLP